MKAYFTLQDRIADWVRECFGDKALFNRQERNHRFLEESLELVQALGCTREDALTLVDYVYSRRKGKPVQEVGGVVVTLGALCECNQVDFILAGEIELKRINQPAILSKIRAKQAAKPEIGPLPGPTVGTAN